MLGTVTEALEGLGSWVLGTEADADADAAAACCCALSFLKYEGG